MVRHIVFEDGIGWVARLRMFALKEFHGDHVVLEIENIFKIEIASTRFFK